MARRQSSEKIGKPGKESHAPLQEQSSVPEAEMASRRKSVETAYTAEYPGLLRIMVAQLAKKTHQNLAVCEERAEEALQETFIRLMSLLHQYDATRPAGPWIRSVAYVVLLEQNPSRKPKREKLAGDMHPDGVVGLEHATRARAPDPAEEFLRQADREDLLRHVDCLSTINAEVLRLMIIEGLDASEVAVRLEVTVETIHVRKSRGLSELRRLVAGANDPAQPKSGEGKP